MHLFRSLTVGLLGACLYTILQLTAAAPGTRAGPAVAAADPVPPSPAPPSVTVVDVAHGVSPAQIVDLLHLGLGERVVAVDDLEVGSDLEAGVVIAGRGTRTREFVDLTIARGDTTRRVLVLQH
ncbi:MAG TPA: hypothetical protein VIU61_26585 [Kofleriaceae bacterium]